MKLTKAMAIMLITGVISVITTSAVFSDNNSYSQEIIKKTTPMYSPNTGEPYTSFGSRVAKGVCNPHKSTGKQSSKCIEATVNIYCKKGTSLAQQSVECILWMVTKMDYEYYSDKKKHPLEAVIQDIKALMSFYKKLGSEVGFGYEESIDSRLWSLPPTATIEQKKPYYYHLFYLITEGEGNSLYYALRDLMEYSRRAPSEEILESSHPQDYLHFKPTKPPNPEVTKLLIEVLTEWPTPAGRAMAADYIATNDDPSAVPALIKALHTEKNVYALITIASALTKYGKRDAVIPVFIQAWNTEQNVKERIAIAEVLIEHGKEDVVLPTLKEYIKEGHGYALKAVFGITDKSEARQILLQAANNKNLDVQEVADEELYKIGEIKLAQKLAINVLENEKRTDRNGTMSRVHAISILGHIGGKKSIKILRDYLKHPIYGGYESMGEEPFSLSIHTVNSALKCIKANRGGPCSKDIY
ncbi:MAG: HEAT repeat domain-containing protein [Deltaproteobacteria bacterium]|nr:HEAT repeat domain-containing protein [Deltaproteobacteria bacterium]